MDARYSSAFWGPGGLLCRLQMQHDGASTAVRPQVLLPMLARELAGLRVEQMMAMQQAVMLEYGWMLGLSSEGMLQLSPLKWIEQPSAGPRPCRRHAGAGDAVRRWR